MTTNLGVHMSNPAAEMRTPVYSGLLLTGSAAIATGLGFAITVLVNQTVARWLLIPVSAAGLGLIAGSIARFTLERRSTQTRFLVAAACLVFGLLSLNWFSAGLLGVHVAPGRLTRPDWLGLGQVALGFFTAWLALTAWAPQPALTLDSGSRGMQDDVFVLPQPTRLLPPPPSPVRVRRPGRWTVTRRQAPPARIKISSVVEHRCPYCLELVADDDPRGVQVCSICGAWHHADCWAVTGMCQVPHHHEV